MIRDKPHLNLVVLGGAGAGKSTAIGHLLYLTEYLDQRALESIQDRAALVAKADHSFAWVVDELPAERERGCTINISLKPLLTANRHFCVIDVPGHFNFAKNMIAGIAQADCALLVVSAQEGELEAARAETVRDQLLLAKAAGIEEVIVVVNKMDHPSARYSEQQFEAVAKQTGKLLEQAGYSPESAQFVPVSAKTGANLKQPSVRSPWYKGPSLLAALDAFRVRARPADSPLRIPVNDVFRIPGIGTVVVGTIQSGKLQAGMPLSFSPGTERGDCCSCEIFHCSADQAKAGDFVGIFVRFVDSKKIRRGQIISDCKDRPATAAKEFWARVTITNHPTKIAVGYTPVVHCHTAHVACEIAALGPKVDPATGEVLEASPRFLRSGDTAEIRLVPQKEMCVEKHSEFPALGSIAISDSKRLVGVGRVIEVTRQRVN